MHSHICVWIENFNKVREILFHEIEETRNQARQELTDYFMLIGQATFGELQFSQTSVITNETFVNKPDDVLNAASKQKIRDMCHHIHSQKLGGIIATPEEKAIVDIYTQLNSGYTSTDLVRNHTCTLIPPNVKLDITTQHQLDMMAYTYPYDAVQNNNMIPTDYHNTQNNNVLQNEMVGKYLF